MADNACTTNDFAGAAQGGRFGAKHTRRSNSRIARQKTHQGCRLFCDSLQDSRTGEAPTFCIVTTT
jgi:hypothetical protein